MTQNIRSQLSISDPEVQHGSLPQSICQSLDIIVTEQLSKPCWKYGGLPLWYHKSQDAFIWEQTMFTGVFYLWDVFNQVYVKK